MLYQGDIWQILARCQVVQDKLRLDQGASVEPMEPKGIWATQKADCAVMRCHLREVFLCEVVLLARGVNAIFNAQLCTSASNLCSAAFNVSAALYRSQSGAYRE